jgi:uncharacterized protein with von Willebrand factor type A (vWA) domain
MTEALPENHYHFYASSVADWVTTNETRDLRALLKMMDKFGYAYNLFLVPVAHDAPYEIKMYQPQVEGTQWLGYYEVKKGKK